MAAAPSSRINSQTALLRSPSNPYGTANVNTDKKDVKVVVENIWERHRISDEFKAQFASKPSLPMSGANFWGSTSNGKPEGLGFKHFFLNDATYFGHWKDGKRDGNGEYLVPNEELYDGSWALDQKNGVGTQHNLDGSYFVGTFSKDQYSNGTLTFEDGSFYNGKWNDDGIFWEGVFVDGSKTDRYDSGRVDPPPSGCCVLL